MDSMKSQKDWLDYINRLQERERQKIISGGLSNWTLFAALTGLGYWIYPDIPYIQRHLLTILFGYVFFTNLATTFFGFFNSYFRQTKVTKYRFPVTDIEKIRTLPLFIHECIMVALAGGLNGYFMCLSFQKQYYYFSVYFAIYCLSYSFNIFVIIITRYHSNIQDYLRDQELHDNPQYDLEETSVDDDGKKEKSIFSKITMLAINLNYESP